MTKIVSIDPMPDAIFSSADYSALGALHYPREHGIKGPDQLAVTGFANEPWNCFCGSPLTSTDQNAYETGKQAVILLVQQLENKKFNYILKTVVLTPDLIMRKSPLKFNKVVRK